MNKFFGWTFAALTLFAFTSAFADEMKEEPAAQEEVAVADEANTEAATEE